MNRQRYVVVTHERTMIHTLVVYARSLEESLREAELELEKLGVKREWIVKMMTEEREK